MIPKTPSEYAAMYKVAKIKPSKEEILVTRAQKLAKFKNSHYGPVALSALGSSDLWWIPACIHNQECGSDIGNFKAVLFNGEKIIGTGKKTSLYPPGKGPFTDWITAAVEALRFDDADKRKSWDLGSALEFFEEYNGLGYRQHGTISPYIWSFTDQYVSGVYGEHIGSDGKPHSTYYPNVVSENFGVAGILKAMEQLDLVDFTKSTTNTETQNMDIKTKLLVLADKIGLDHDPINKLIEKAGDHTPNFWAVFDVGQKSSVKRLHILDLASNTVENYYVAHGSGSDRNNDGIADKFSMEPGSECTSLGVYRCGETHQCPKHGREMLLDGLDSTNSNARARAIVFHRAPYVTAAHVGRSSGCPAVEPQFADKLIDELHDGSYLIIWKK